jgi:hypothetical protein
LIQPVRISPVHTLKLVKVLGPNVLLIAEQAHVGAPHLAREQQVPRTARRQPMRRSERLAMPFHLLGAEQFRAELRPHEESGRCSGHVAAHRLNDTREFEERPVPGRLNDPTAVLSDLGVDQLVSMCLERG